MQLILLFIKIFLLVSPKPANSSHSKLLNKSISNEFIVKGNLVFLILKKNFFLIKKEKKFSKRFNIFFIL
ncbi:hypothetical protein AMC76_00605 [Candidatus Carsonella ruddii]|nr:hypothetical protein CRDC_00565 [Candidatus Carsonella ruddii DC]ALA96846.1 hypothetical protein AMC76_00605 [Candidatus Carsonella ruddii]